MYTMSIYHRGFSACFQQPFPVYSAFILHWDGQKQLLSGLEPIKSPDFILHLGHLIPTRDFSWNPYC